MTKSGNIIIAVILCWLSSVAVVAQVGSLRCNHLCSPLGVDSANPHLSWQPAPKTVNQIAYHILVSTDSLSLLNDKGNIWDSGRIASDKIDALYKGKQLEPCTTYYWKVKTWNQNNEMEDSSVSSFETGLIDSKNWQGSWITDTHDYNVKPAAYFRKEYKTTKNSNSARAYIAVAGLYELYINGKKIGNHRLDPMYTRFDRRTLYLTHDVTSNLLKGDNAIGVLLGNGWYNHQSTAVWNFDKAPWRGRPKFCMDVHITYTDGTTDVVSTTSSWKTAHSPVIFNSIYTAEHYDARKEQPDWDKPGFSEKNWKNATNTFAPSNNIVSQQIQPIRDVKEITPKSVNKLNDKEYVFDLGQNISGVSEITLKGNAGATIRLIHAERVKEDGNVDMSNIDYHYRPKDNSDPFQTDIFILKGEGEESFRARFNYKGFQYVQVKSDTPLELDINSLKAYFMHSDVPVKGKIHSSDPLLNKIWEATNNSYLSNLFGYPTDCPQREKNGWTGDAHIAIETALYNFDGITVYEKWLADHQDEQLPNGVLPAIIPTSGWGYHWGNGVDWTSTIAIIPWNIYLFYGDIRPLQNVYDNIKRYVDYIDRTYPSGLTDWGLGDWIPIKSKANKELTSSIYFYVDAQILANAAKLLGEEPDYQKYTRLSQKIKDAINNKFLNEDTGVYCNGLQTEQSMPLFWGVVPEDMKSPVARKLAEKVMADKQMDVGLLGSKAILNALSENGYVELAYELAFRDTYPSWGWWIKNGATTLYENWRIDGNKDISLNHIMFGEISAWYYKALGGIFPDPANPGFKNIILKPNFVSKLGEFEARHISPYGEIISSWARKKDKVTYKVAVPPNSTASLTLKGESIGQPKEQREKVVLEKNGDGFVTSLVSGEYLFEIKCKR